jgi:hypothetical protein
MFARGVPHAEPSAPPEKLPFAFLFSRFNSHIARPGRLADYDSGRNSFHNSPKNMDSSKYREAGKWGSHISNNLSLSQI